MADLCDPDDVYQYAPGFDADDGDNIDTAGVIEALIDAITVETIERTGLEFVAIDPALDPRTFDVGCQLIEHRTLRIGSASAVSSVVQKRNGATVQTFALGTDVVLLPRVRQVWQPYTQLWFPTLTGSPALFIEEDTIEVSATWGYPSVPADIRQACAKLVIVRYLTDVAAAGTALADALTTGGDINIGGLFRSATEVIDRYSIP